MTVTGRIGTGKTAVRPRSRGRRSRSKKKSVGSNRQPVTFAHPNGELSPGIGNISWLESLAERLGVRFRCRGHMGCLDDDCDEDALEVASDLTGLTPQHLRGHMAGTHRN